MKTKGIKGIIASLLSCIIVLTNVIPAQAADPLTTLGETVALVTDAVVESYEASVISQMIGRAGSGSVYGAKGIAFEVVYKDIKNLENFFCIYKPSEKITLSTSSIDTVADLVVTNADGSVVRLIQCKDGVSTTHIRNILQQVMDGQYAEAQLVGTKECAAEFNRLAEASGIDARMIDSGISTELTKSLAEKALGGSISTLVKNIGKSAKAGGVFCGAIAAIESAVRGDTVPEAVGNITTSAANGAISTGAATAVGSLVTMGFAALGTSSAVSTVGVFAAAIITGGALMTGLESLSDSLGIEEAIAECYEAFMTGAGNFLVGAGETIGKVGSGIAWGATEVANGAGKLLDDAGKFWGNALARWF